MMKIILSVYMEVDLGYFGIRGGVKKILAGEVY